MTDCAEVTRIFQRPETVIFWAEIKNLDCDLYDPSEGVFITIRDPKDNVLVDSQAMTRDSEGIYTYSWNSSLAEAGNPPVPVNPPGWYKSRIYAVDGVGPGEKRVVQLGAFELQ